MKNISRTIRLLNVEYPVKTENGFETRNDTVVDMDAAAIARSLRNVALKVT